MQLSRADVGMIDATQAKVFKHLSEISHVSRQLFRSHSRVFNHTDGFGITFHSGEQAQTCLAQTPYLADFGAIDS